MTKKFKHLKQFAQEHAPSDRKLISQVLLVIGPMLLGAAVDLILTRPFPNLVSCAVPMQNTTMLNDIKVNDTMLNDGKVNGMNGTLFFNPPRLSECFLQCPDLDTTEYYLLANDPPGDGWGNFLTNCVILGLVSLLLGLTLYRTRKLQMLCNTLLQKGLYVAINRKYHLILLGAIAFLVLCYSIIAFVSFGTLTQNRFLTCPSNGVKMAVEFDANYSLNWTNVITSVALMALFGKAALKEIFDGFSNVYSSLDFKALIKSPHRAHLLEEMKHIRRVELSKLIEAINAYLETRSDEFPKVALKQTTLEFDGEQVPCNAKYFDEDIGLCPEQVFNIVLDSGQLSMRVMESEELESMRQPYLRA